MGRIVNYSGKDAKLRFIVLSQFYIQHKPTEKHHQKIIHALIKDEIIMAFRDNKFGLLSQVYPSFSL
jgi:hypothetical protein